MRNYKRILFIGLIAILVVLFAHQFLNDKNTENLNYNEKVDLFFDRLIHEKENELRIEFPLVHSTSDNIFHVEDSEMHFYEIVDKHQILLKFLRTDETQHPVANYNKI